MKKPIYETKIEPIMGDIDEMLAIEDYRLSKGIHGSLTIEQQKEALRRWQAKVNLRKELKMINRDGVNMGQKK